MMSRNRSRQVDVRSGVNGSNIQNLSSVICHLSLSYYVDC
jgi:hypothetical protein